ncbi:MAG: GNAT family N-acetyltransferase [Methyloglobulus sp.]|nr:GNAT family N-acetyltransferase [Methyloglobulus sp.]
MSPQKAEIRAFFVHPDFARKGVATHILGACENECLRRGIKSLYLTATLAGEPFYKKKDFSGFHRFNQILSNGETFELVKMAKKYYG